MKQGILVISHGSREENWILHVEDIVKRGAEAFAHTHQEYTTIPVVSAYLELAEGRLIQDGIDSLEREGVTHIYVMPLFISYGSTHVEEIKQAFGFQPISDFIGDLEPFKFQSEIIFSEPIMDDLEVLEILSEQLDQLSDNPMKEGLLLIGHGSSYSFFYDRWSIGMEKLLQQLVMKYPFAQSDYASLLPEQSYDKFVKLQLHQEVQDIIVLPIFISPGYFTQTVIPKRLNGLSYKYNGEALLPHEGMIGLLHRRFVELIASKP